MEKEIVGGFLNLNESFEKTFGPNEKIVNLNESSNQKNDFIIDIFFYLDKVKINPKDRTKPGKIKVQSDVLDINSTITTYDDDSDEDIAGKISQLIFKTDYLANFMYLKANNKTFIETLSKEIEERLTGFNPEVDTEEVEISLKLGLA